MKVLFCVSEAVPLARTGGLADVGGALPAALMELGTDVGLALPRYRGIGLAGSRPAGTVEVQVGAERLPVGILDGTMPDTGVPAWLVDQPRLFNRAGLYGEGGKDYPDNLARFASLCRALLTWLERQSRQPDLFHCNAWDTALVPLIIGAVHAGPSGTVL